jgi:hypothetical protein
VRLDHLDHILATDLPCSEKMVLVAIASHINETSTKAWPSITRLAKLAGLDRSTVVRVVARLEESGHLIGHHRHGRSTEYALNTAQHATSGAARLVAQEHATSGAARPALVAPRAPNHPEEPSKKGRGDSPPSSVMGGETDGRMAALAAAGVVIDRKPSTRAEWAAVVGSLTAVEVQSVLSGTTAPAWPSGFPQLVEAWRARQSTDAGARRAAAEQQAEADKQARIAAWDRESRTEAEALVRGLAVADDVDRRVTKAAERLRNALQRGSGIGACLRDLQTAIAAVKPEAVAS